MTRYIVKRRWWNRKWIVRDTEFRDCWPIMYSYCWDSRDKACADGLAGSLNKIAEMVKR